MKNIFACLLFFLCCIVCKAQNFGLLQADSLKHELSLAKDDTSRINAQIASQPFATGGTASGTHNEQAGD